MKRIIELPENVGYSKQLVRLAEAGLVDGRQGSCGVFAVNTLGTLSCNTAMHSRNPWSWESGRLFTIARTGSERRRRKENKE